ncbi:MAG TPA: hypothetical protein VGR92_02255 [Steroidobacteraceae bacterium]|nr:hypothetical protein [Steroidobacteraceae bacterium]
MLTRQRTALKGPRYGLCLLAAAVAIAVAAGAHAAAYRYIYVRQALKGISANGIAIANCACGKMGGVGRVLIYRHGAKTELDPPGMRPASDVVAIAINNHDEILLSCHNTATGRLDFFLYDLDRNSFRLIGKLGRLVSNAAFKDFRITGLIALNDNDEVLAGFTGHVRSNDFSGVRIASGVAYGEPAMSAPGSLEPPAGLGEFTQVPKPPCLGNPSYTAMNDRHQITGVCVLAANRSKPHITSFIETDGAVVEVAAPGSMNTRVTAINNSGVVVGFFQPVKTMDNRAFRFDGKAYTTLLWSPKPARSADVVNPAGISDTGAVAGAVVTATNDTIGFIAVPEHGRPVDISDPGWHVPPKPAPPPPRPLRSPPPAAATPAPRGFVTRSYMGTHASVRGGVLTFTAMGAGGGRQLTFSVLPVGRPGSAGASAWIAKDARGYVMFTVVPSGTVSGIGLPASMARPTYERALNAQGGR